MNVKLSLHSPEVMRAFAVFLNTVAEAQEIALKDPTRNRGFGLGALVGGIDRSANTLWRNGADTAANHINELPDAPVREDEYTPPAPPSVLNEASVQQAVAKRERGKPSPGRARRTKEEIEEDRLAEEAELKDINDQENAERNQDAGMTAAQAEELKAPVVSGPVDTPEVEAQDKADEQAEVEANRSEEQPLTSEDLRAAMGAYVNTYGLAAAQADGPTIFLDALGAVPSGTTDAEGKPVTTWKLSVVPEQKLSAAIAAWKSAVESNPFDRAKVA